MTELQILKRCPPDIDISSTVYIGKAGGQWTFQGRLYGKTSIKPFPLPQQTIIKQHQEHQTAKY